MANRPGGELSNRPLHFIWICDCSGSMSVDGKIERLNIAIRETIPLMQDVARENVNAQVLVRAVKFSNGATWHIAKETPVESFQWNDLTADGATDMGKALSLVAEAMKIPPMSERALPPVLVLLSDGYPTDSYKKGLKELLDQNWGRKAVRIAIAIGKDADRDMLKEFIDNPELPVLEANNPDQLVNRIKWVSTVVLKAASSPASRVMNQSAKPAANVVIPVPVDNELDSAADVW